MDDDRIRVLQAHGVAREDAVVMLRLADEGSPGLRAETARRILAEAREADRGTV